MVLSTAAHLVTRAHMAMRAVSGKRHLGEWEAAHSSARWTLTRCSGMKTNGRMRTTRGPQGADWTCPRATRTRTVDQVCSGADASEWALAGCGCWGGRPASWGERTCGGQFQRWLDSLLRGVLKAWQPRRKTVLRRAGFSQSRLWTNSPASGRDSSRGTGTGSGVGGATLGMGSCKLHGGNPG